MAGKSPTRHADARVLAAMMDDLGNHRLEELAQDHARISRHRPAPLVNAPSQVGPARPRNGRARRNSLSEMYHSAIKDGHFDDDDAAGVSGLDPLDGGNAHRINRSARQPFGQLRNEPQAYDVMGAPRQPNYDPSEPTYHRKGKLRRLDPNANYYPNGPRVSSLGGIGPDGSGVKRWDAGTPANRTKDADNLLNRPAGRGRPVSSRKESPLAQPVQVPGHGRGGGGPLPNLFQVTENGLQTPTQQPQEIASCSHGKLTQPLQSPMNGTLPGIATTSEPRVPRSVSLPQAISTGSVSKTAPNIGHEASESGFPSSRDTSWVPPHLRKASGIQSAAQSPTVPRQASPPLSQGKSETTALDQSVNVHKITSLDAREIFFQNTVYVVEYGGGNKSASGRIVIYELLDAPVCVWELTIEEKEKVIRGDIRELLEVLPNGSMAYLRRHREGGPVRSNPLRFSGIDEAQIFINEANIRRDQYSRSSEAIYTETTAELSPAQYATAHLTTVELAEKATHGAAVDSTATSGRKLDTSGLMSPQPRQLTPMRSNPEEPKLVKLTTEFRQHNVEPRSHTPPIPFLTAKGESTPLKVTSGDYERTGSGWSDKDLISFSPEPADGPSQSDEVARLEYEQPIFAESCTLADAGNLSGLPSEKQVDPEEQVYSSTTGGEHETGQETKRLHTAEETTKALRNIEVIDTVDKPSLECRKFLWGITEDYTGLIQKSTLLSIALDTPYSKAAFVTTLIHLVEMDEFLKLSRDDQKSSLAFAHAIVRHGDSPIIRSQEEILALRSGEEACPEAIKELNALIKGKGRGWGPPVSRHIYRPEVTIEGVSANNLFLYGSGKSELLI
ncbi:hypothetical protein F4824DRAFT_196184 [Ustulina deusta]|nr:hypothetical protein F4824DRAFT_196184 [Ustulina deusta]